MSFLFFLFILIKNLRNFTFDVDFYRGRTDTNISMTSPVKTIVSNLYITDTKCQH
jgi:hypothetical protein